MHWLYTITRKWEDKPLHEFTQKSLRYRRNNLSGKFLCYKIRFSKEGLMRSFLLLLVITINFIYGESLGVLKEVMKPSRITVSGQEVYISDDKKIKVISLKDLKLIREIGKREKDLGSSMLIPV